MNKPNLTTLIDKFWKGESTLEEENELKYHLEDFDFEDEYPELYEYFNLIETEKSVTITKDFKAVLKNIPENTTVKSESKPSNKKFQYWMAASILLTITIFSLQKQDKIKQQKEAQLAFEDVKTSLAFFSKKLNKTTPYLEHVQKFAQTQDKINKTLNR